jgi:hypothetical protein
MKKLLNWKWVALLLLVVAGLVAIGSGNASQPSDENRACTDAILNGAYQWNASGYIQTTNVNGGNIADFAPIVEASFAAFDGRGTITKLVSIDNFSSGGPFTVTGTGTYSVNPDCTGSITFNTPGPLKRQVVIRRDGESADFLNTDPGIIIAGTMKKRTERNATH